MTDSALDAHVATVLGELRDRAELAAPRAVAWLATGGAELQERLEGTWRTPLGALGAPAPWKDAAFVSGTLGGTPVWLLEPADEPSAGAPDRDAPPWAAAFPLWLAAAAGARVFVLTAAGAALPAGDGGTASFPEGTVVALADHVNLSGGTPLEGLGESRLGPLFPDQTTLHDPALRAAALREARELGLATGEAVAACAPGPAMETPAERRWFAHAGAAVSVQGLATPLIAAAHAGLVGVALVAVADVGDRPIDLARVVAAANALRPGLADLVAALAPDLARRAEQRLAEVPA